MSSKNLVILDGGNLTPEMLYSLAKGDLKIDLSQNAWECVQKSRQFVEELASKPTPVYGINTGFGNFATVSIPDNKLDELQVNLITSHAAGVGDALSVERTRMLLALRINVLAKGCSGISVKVLKQMVDAFNKNCLSFVPEQGTVGASGDLAPLSHLALGLIGQGLMYDDQTQSYLDAMEVLTKHQLQPIELKAKEGLAMINGTQFICALGCEAVMRAQNCCLVADIVGALSLEVLKGTPKAFDEKIHQVRPHTGQVLCAQRLRTLLKYGDPDSTLQQSHLYCSQVQDSYTLRCMPQVHGIANDTVKFTYGIFNTECNSATDNPMIFADSKQSISGGNFHGEYVAKACDFLAIGIHELASISERRIERLVNSSLSGLPPFLTEQGGLNSGFMIAHCTAASLVSENKVLCHPASVDSISTSASKEDHVSMGGFSARKALKVVEHVERVLAIELACSCQALDMLRPLKTTSHLERVYECVRSAGVKKWIQDRYMAPDLNKCWQLVKSGDIVNAVGQVEGFHF
ncbi:hypothetical protein MIR68_000179 [Amoeboaphelidium protococcarum]|nr:hypothetical protein MIR68_000179 [Amoeboaphelidium protococcarum]